MNIERVEQYSIHLVSDDKKLTVWAKLDGCVEVHRFEGESTVEVVGSIRPAPLSSSNVTTLLSTYWPDLLLAAMMVRAAGYQKNYGQGVDDPKMAMSWEQHYKELLAGADVEEMRKKFTSEGWSSDDPAKIATPPRT
mgnify:CR=1 FL=1